MPRNVCFALLSPLLEVIEWLDVVFPVHPRTRGRIQEFGIDAARIHLMGPQAYIQFLVLQRRAALVITDSGGIQEETTYLGIACLTVRDNTERPVTVTLGTNVLVGRDRAKLRTELSRILDGNGKRGTIPPLWDGHAGERAADVVQKVYGL